MALSIKCEGSFSADGEQMFFQDTTGTYNAVSNTGGYGAPNSASTTVTTFQVICNWISAGAIVTYNFTVSSGTITVATVTDSAGTVVNILADLASTAFPIVDPNFLDLTDTFDDAIVLPTLEDGQFQLTYKVISSSVPFTYTTSTTYFADCSLKCCISEKRLTADTNCEDCGVMKNVNEAEYWWKSALCAVAVGKSNETALKYFTKAQEICESECDECG